MRREGKSRVIESKKLHIENKTLFIDLKENSGGRFVQIAELSNDKRSMVIIPETGLADFLQTINRMVEAYQLSDSD